MADKLNEGDVFDVNEINELMNKVKLLKPPIRPLDVNGKKYYFWIQGKDGGWIPSDDPGAREALLGVIGEDWFYEDSKNE